MKISLKIFLCLCLFATNSIALQFKELYTDNGVKFWFVQDDSIPIVSISFSFKGGSFLDPSNKLGVTNLMTSLLDEGTEKYSSIDFKNKIKSNGVRLSLSTAKSKIQGSFQVVSSNSDKGFELLQQALNLPLFEQNEILKVKNQIVSSIKIDNSDLSRLASKEFNSSFYENHNFNNPVKGTLESINDITQADIKKIFSESITKNVLTIGVSGNISEKEIKEKIGYVFGKLPEIKSNLSIPKFPSLKKGNKKIFKQAPQTAVVFGQQGLKRSDEDFFAARIVNYVIGGGSFQSRLYKNVREKRGLVYSIYSYLMPYENDGILAGGFQTKNESVGEVIKLIKKEWRKVKKEGISKKEFEDAKTYFKGSFSQNFTSTLSIASLLEVVQYYQLGNNYFSERNDIIDSLDLKYVNKVANKILDEKKLYFLSVGES